MLIALASAALLAGFAGAWSPCGFSIVDTLAPHGYAQRLRVTLLGCLAFALGALAGGVATFGGLAALGQALGAGGGAAVALAVAALLAAAAGDAAGRRIVPQVRRQVPESWRRVLPLPLAAGLYGVLLGLGFTTFVLSFGVYALAAACLALGDPAAGIVAGLAFGAGRSLPVAVLAPLQDHDRGARIAAAMAERPQVLRALRAAGAVALGAAALALALGGAPAAAATITSYNGTDPSWDGTNLAWQQPLGGAGLIRDATGLIRVLPGSDPALGSGNVVWREGETLVVADAGSLLERQRVPAPGAEEPAVSDRWLVWRAREPTGDVLRMFDLLAPHAAPNDIRRIAAPGRIGRPSIASERVVFHVSRTTSSRIEEIFLPTRRRTVLRSSRVGAQLLNPSEHGDELAFIRASYERQEVKVGPRRTRDGSRDLRVYSTYPPAGRDAGVERGRHPHRAGYPGGRPRELPRRAPDGVAITLWSTALAADAVYVSRERRTAEGSTTVILRVER